MEKADLSEGYQNPKRKQRVIVHFSEKILKVKIWKEIAIHSLYFNAFLGLWLFDYL